MAGGGSDIRDVRDVRRSEAAVRRGKVTRE